MKNFKTFLVMTYFKQCKHNYCILIQAKVIQAKGSKRMEKEKFLLCISYAREKIVASA